MGETGRTRYRLVICVCVHVDHSCRASDPHEIHISLCASCVPVCVYQGGVYGGGGDGGGGDGRVGGGDGGGGDGGGMNCGSVVHTLPFDNPLNTQPYTPSGI